jgi:hypothetical protein
MSDPGFTLAYDVIHSGARVFWFPAFGLTGILIGLCLPWLIRNEILRGPKWMLPWFPIAWLFGAIMWTIVATLGVGGEYLRDRYTLSSGKADYVEGVVENFVPMPAAGHANESFTVNGVTFSYSDYEVTPGFNNAASHGGPVRQGLYVRIWYVGNDILKLEIKKPTHP